MQNVAETPYQIAASTQNVDNERNPIGFFNKTNDSRKEKETPNESRNDSRKGNGNRECAYCQTLFVYNTANHKYCRDKCRMAAYEKRTGKNLPKYKKGGKK